MFVGRFVGGSVCPPTYGELYTVLMSSLMLDVLPQSLFAVDAGLPRRTPENRP